MIKDSGNRRDFNTGAVRDMAEGKGRMDLLPWAAIMEVSKHCENGANKYGEHNVDNGIPTHSFCDSAARHLAKYLDGWTDEPHLLAATWNLLWAVEMELKHPELVDTPWKKEGKAEESRNETSTSEAVDISLTAALLKAIGIDTIDLDASGEWYFNGKPLSKIKAENAERRLAEAKENEKPQYVMPPCGCERDAYVDKNELEAVEKAFEKAYNAAFEKACDEYKDAVEDVAACMRKGAGTLFTGDGKFGIETLPDKKLEAKEVHGLYGLVKALESFTHEDFERYAGTNRPIVRMPENKVDFFVHDIFWPSLDPECEPGVSFIFRGPQCDGSFNVDLDKDGKIVRDCFDMAKNKREKPIDMLSVVGKTGDWETDYNRINACIQYFLNDDSTRTRIKYDGHVIKLEKDGPVVKAWYEEHPDVVRAVNMCQYDSLASWIVEKKPEEKEKIRSFEARLASAIAGVSRGNVYTNVESEVGSYRISHDGKGAWDVECCIKGEQVASAAAVMTDAADVRSWILERESYLTDRIMAKRAKDEEKPEVRRIREELAKAEANPMCIFTSGVYFIFYIDFVDRLTIYCPKTSTIKHWNKNQRHEAAKWIVETAERMKSNGQ